jgi:hypothetical protein
MFAKKKITVVGPTVIFRADWQARAAIDTFRRVHEQLRSRGEISFVFCGMNAIDQAGIDALLVFSCSYQ